eukprot:TRINITY_DN20666_c0_g1_i3.p1 TRINITY_DN20666_c0_g1~~TRINITY_DN20666_c0_g1_i3.p1  ORF type:complete len:444 (-),score=71.90 TRINITY_DN20666_c0_g1_i3:58-1389(-)
MHHTCFVDSSHFVSFATLDSASLCAGDTFVRVADLGAGEAFVPAWLASVARQLIEALQYCHELRPHSIVHGDLRLESVLLASVSDVAVDPQVMLADLGLAGVLPAPPNSLRQARPSHEASTSSLRVNGHEGKAAGAAAPQAPSPKRDVWSCGCMLYIVLTGQHPLRNDDISGALMPPRLASDSARGMKESELPDFGLEALSTALGSATSLIEQMLALRVEDRPTSAECLQHPWLAPTKSALDDRELPLDTLPTVVQLYARAKFRQVVTSLVVSELSSGPRPYVGSVLQACRGAQMAQMPRAAAATELIGIGVSENTADKVLRAFDPDCTGLVNFAKFVVACCELAEDRLDHALWRVFTAVGEEHRGVLGAAELERILVAEPGQNNSADWAGGAEHYIRGSLDPELPGSATAQQVTQGAPEVTFEVLKSFVMQRSADLGDINPC